MGGVLQHKNGGVLQGSLSSKLRKARKVGDTNAGRTAILFRQVVGVGVSEALPTNADS